MQKISPLRSSIEAFNKFKSLRKDKTQKSPSTNPFGIAFKGTVIQMDVFENSNSAVKENSVSEKFKNTGKLLASAWVSTLNKFSSIKTNAIAFGNKLKDNSIQLYKKAQELANTKIEFDVFKYNVSNLQKQPVGVLRSMLCEELKGAANNE